MTKNVDVIIHTACTAYEGLSVFSPYLVGQILIKYHCQFSLQQLQIM